ncbi:MAG: tetratricopeptide repeat protein [Elusimicrobia bacterium]|nr:tetratricopeptide repeat protein [Elusimicrobiota bacterium]
MTACLLAGFLAALSAVAAQRPVPSREARQALASAIALYDRADFKAALSGFNRALVLYDGWKTALGHRALCRWNMGDRKGADEDALFVLRLRPNDAASFVSRGMARFVVKDYPAAEADFAQALKLDPAAAEAHFGLGSVASAKGDLGRALQSLDQAVLDDRGFATAFLVRGTVQERRKDFAAAIRNFDRVLEINPRFTWARFYRGRCRREVKDYRGALSDFDEFISAHPDFVEAVYLRSNVRFLAGDYAGAESDLGAVISLDPKRGLAYSNRGQARAQLGDRAGALADLKKALELLPDKRAKIQAAIDNIEGAQSQASEAALREGGRSDAAAPSPAQEPSEPAYVSSEEGRTRKRPARQAAAVDEVDSAPGQSAPAPVVQGPASAPAKPAPRRDRWDDAGAAPPDADTLGLGPDEAGLAPAPAKRPKPAKAALEEDLPAPARKGAAPQGDGQDVPRERSSGQEESLIIE